MGLVIHKEKVTAELGEKLKSICPFGAISYDVSNGLSIGMGCKLCKLCVKKGEGAVTFEEAASWRSCRCTPNGRTAPRTRSSVRSARSARRECC